METESRGSGRTSRWEINFVHGWRQNRTEPPAAGPALVRRPPDLLPLGHSQLVDEADLASGPDDADRPTAEKALDAGLPTPELETVLTRVPGGMDAAADRLFRHVHEYRPNPASGRMASPP